MSASAPDAPARAAPDLMVTTAKTFRFEAAHRFDHEDPNHPFSRLHGHSFAGRVELRGPAAAPGGFVQDFWALERIMTTALADFDHGYLNDIADLPTPSLENIARTLFTRLATHIPYLFAVEVSRPSCGESARVERPQPLAPSDPVEGRA